MYHTPKQNGLAVLRVLLYQNLFVFLFFSVSLSIHFHYVFSFLNLFYSLALIFKFFFFFCFTIIAKLHTYKISGRITFRIL